VSAQPTKAARGTATFWFGNYDRGPDDELPQAPPVAHEIKAELESQGFECKFTSSEWLSVRVPPPFSNILDESDDDELFGDPVHRRIGQWLMGFANTMRNNPAEISGLDPSDGEEYDSDLEDIREEAKTLKQVADAFIRQGMQAGLIMWQDNSEDWWWERIAAELEEETDISLEQLFDEHGMNESAESDDELFGDGEQKVFVVSAPDDEILGMFSDIREAIAHAKKQVPIYLEDGWGDDDFITVYKQRGNNDSGVPVAHFPITDNPIDESNDDDDLFAAPRIRFGDVFNEYDEDQLQALGFSYGDDPEQDVDIINHYIEDHKNFRVVGISGGEHDLILHLDRSSRLRETDDDELFGRRWHENINRRSIEIDGIDSRDYPDFVDAHIVYAETQDGKPLTDEQLDQLNDMYHDSGELNELVHDQLYESDESNEDRHAL
jgi:hypothetical protein